MKSVSLRKFFLFLISFQFLFCFSVPVFATTQKKDDKTKGSANEISDKFCSIVRILQGGPMKSVAIIAIMAVGIGTFTGRFQWATALVTGAGIIVIFSAPTVVSIFAGGEKGDYECKIE